MTTNKKYKRYTSQEKKKIKELVALGFSTEKIAEELGRPVPGLHFKISKMGGRSKMMPATVKKEVVVKHVYAGKLDLLLSAIGGAVVGYLAVLFT